MRSVVSLPAMMEGVGSLVTRSGTQSIGNKGNGVFCKLLCALLWSRRAVARESQWFFCDEISLSSDGELLTDGKRVKVERDLRICC